MILCKDCSLSVSLEFLEEVEEQNYYLTVPQNVPFMDENLIFPETQRKLYSTLEKQRRFNVSREQSRNLWGIPVPGDNDSLIYVWFDALLNYLSTAEHLGLISKKNVNGAIKLDVNEEFGLFNIIGKDIIKFHSIFFPLMMNSYGESIQSKISHSIYSHYHWIADNVKIILP